MSGRTMSIKPCGKFNVAAGPATGSRQKKTRKKRKSENLQNETLAIVLWAETTTVVYTRKRKK